MRPPIEGHRDARFPGVLDAFQQNFALEDEIGAALCVRVDGRVVVDLRGGWCDAAHTRPWQRDTLVGACSMGKGIGSILTLVLAEAGLLDLEARVADLWPGSRRTTREGCGSRTCSRTAPPRSSRAATAREALHRSLRTS